MIVGQQQNFKYAVILDCGSSGSRAHIYYWPAEAEARLFPSAVRSLKDAQTGQPLTMNIRPGLATFSSDPEAASDYLRPLMQFASRHVPVEAQADTPVYIMATAGMRLLEERERGAIWKDIERDIRAEFPRFKLISCQMISGAEEGAYQWLSVNALSGRLNESFSQERGAAFYFQAPSSRRLGILEMGGASAQVTYEVSSRQLDNLVSSMLKPKHQPEAYSVFQESRVIYELQQSSAMERVQLFSATFLGFGGDSARALLVDLLVRDSLGSQMVHPTLARYGSMAPFFVGPNSTLVIEDPCLVRGSHETHEKPLELLYGQSKVIGYRQRPGARETVRVQLLGRGNYAACRFQLTRVAALAKQERTNCDYLQQIDERQPCATALINTQFVPWRQVQLIGLAELFYTQSEIFNTVGQLDGPKLQLATARLCSLTFNQLNSELPARNDFESRRNLLACTKASWIIVWLANVLRMPIDSHAHSLHYDLKTLNNFAAEQIDWTLGALIARQLESMSRLKLHLG